MDLIKILMPPLPKQSRTTQHHPPLHSLQRTQAKWKHERWAVDWYHVPFKSRGCEITTTFWEHQPGYTNNLLSEDFPPFWQKLCWFDDFQQIFKHLRGDIPPKRRLANVAAAWSLSESLKFFCIRERQKWSRLDWLGRRGAVRGLFFISPLLTAPEVPDVNEWTFIILQTIMGISKLVIWRSQKSCNTVSNPPTRGSNDS